MTKDLSWKTEIELLESNGEKEKVIDLLRAAAQGGDTLARIVLAEKYWKENRYEEAGREIEIAEKLIQPDDGDAHWELHCAYSLGVSTLTGLERYRKAFLHLCIAAEVSGDPLDYIAVAIHYWRGLNGVDVDLEKAEKLLDEAASSGWPEAIAEYERFKEWRNANETAGKGK